MSQSLGAKVLSFFRAPKEKRVSEGSLPNVYNWVSNIIREPFTGAWQRNMECASNETLLRNSAVFTCVSSIAQDIAKMDARVVRVGADGDTSEIALNHPADRLLRKPNAYQNGFDFTFQILCHLLLVGQTLIYKMRDRRQVVNALHILVPGTVETLITPNGEVWYRIDRGNNQMLGGDGTITVPASEIIHHRTITLLHPLVGATPILAAGVSATMGNKIAANSSRFFENMSRTSGVLTTAEKISPEAAKLIKQMWEDAFRAGEFGRTAVLSQGLKWDPLTMTAVDAQLIEQLRWTIEDIARVFRFPSFMLGSADKVTYRNSEQMQRVYYSGCLQPHIEALELRLTDGLELASDLRVQFDLDALFRTEMDVRYDSYAKGLNAGFLTINEVRSKEGLPAVEGGDKPHLQQQYVPLGTPPAPAPAPVPAPAPAPEPAPTPAPEE